MVFLTNLVAFTRILFQIVINNYHDLSAYFNYNNL